MKIKSSNPNFHIFYWILVIVVLTLVFGRSWGDNTYAFYFVSMLLPIVLGTSYFFNYFLVPKFFMKKKYVSFGIYTLYTIIVSIYLETLVLIFAFIYFAEFDRSKLGPNATDTVLLAVIMYLLIFLGSFSLLLKQIREKQRLINQLKDEKEKMKIPILELMSNRKMVKIPYDEIIFIESMSDYIRVNTAGDHIMSKEKISKLGDRLPEMFIRIHRSFIINKDRIKSYTYNEVQVDDVYLNIGRSYKKNVRELLNKAPKS